MAHIALLGMQLLWLPFKGHSWGPRDRKGAVGQGEMVKGAYLVIKLYVKLPSAQ